MTTIKRFLMFIAYTVTMVFFEGFVLSRIWNWILVPVFSYVPLRPLSFFGGVGVFLIADLLRYKQIMHLQVERFDNEFDYGAMMLRDWFSEFLVVFIFLLLGFLAKSIF